MAAETPNRHHWPVTDDNGDYIFRLPLQAGAGEPPEDAFAELMRSQLDEILKLVILTYHGEKVRIDGFRFIHEPDVTRPIWRYAEPEKPPTQPT